MLFIVVLAYRREAREEENALLRGCVTPVIRHSQANLTLLSLRLSQSRQKERDKQGELTRSVSRRRTQRQNEVRDDEQSQQVLPASFLTMGGHYASPGVPRRQWVSKKIVLGS